MGMIACLTAVDAAARATWHDDPAAVEELLDTSADERTLDLDKAWHGIHFLLTGAVEGGPEPLASAVLGGVPVGEDLGYGPARWLAPEQVAEIASALDIYDRAALYARYDPDAMTRLDVYPGVMWARDRDAAFDYLWEYFTQMVAFYRATAERGEALLLWLT